MTFHRKCTLNCAAVLTVNQQFDGLLSLSVSVPGACQVTARPQGEAANTEALRQCSWLCDLGPVLCSRRVTVGVAGEEGPVRCRPRAFCSLGMRSWQRSGSRRGHAGMGCRRQCGGGKTAGGSRQVGGKILEGRDQGLLFLRIPSPVLASKRCRAGTRGRPLTAASLPPRAADKLFLLDQCEKYQHCKQCGRSTSNLGESNLWPLNKFLRGSRLFV